MTTGCPSCRESNYKELPFGGYEYNGVKLPLVRCEHCSLQYVLHNLSNEEIDSFYNVPEYFNSEYAGGAVKDYASSRVEQEEKAHAALRVIKKYKPKGKFLDIGCAGGYLVALAKSFYGYDSYGAELSQLMVEYGTKELGVTIHNGTIYDLPADWGNFDVIYLGDVLEHVPDPHRFLQAIRARLSPGGLVVFEVPMTYNWTLSGLVIGLVNIVRGRLGRIYFLPAQHRTNFVKKAPYHLLMFTKRSMRSFLMSENFTVRYLKIYEGAPKTKFGKGFYSSLKIITSFLTHYLPQATFGDRMIVIGEKR